MVVLQPDTAAPGMWMDPILTSIDIPERSNAVTTSAKTGWKWVGLTGSSSAQI
jgi:hypothetical protein